MLPPARRLRPVAVRASSPYRIRLRCDDGVEGEADLSEMAASGVFEAWQDQESCSGVQLGPAGSIAWRDDIDLCGDARCLELTGLPPQERFPLLRNAVDA